MSTPSAAWIEEAPPPPPLNLRPFEAMAREAADRARAEFEAAPATKPCRRHPDQHREKFADEHSGRPEYHPCHKCAQLKKDVALVEAGVPPNLLHCTFENFIAENPAEAQIAQTAQEYAKARQGVLILSGAYGRGKSHLAVAIARTVPGARFITHGQLLAALRLTYKDQRAVDIAAITSEVEMLIIDELGASAGGRDDAPLLHEVLCARYDWRRPTIITTNLPADQLENVVGPRVMDRLREATCSVLTLAGPSRRIARRDEYIASAPEPEVMAASPWFKPAKPNHSKDW